MAFQVKDLMVTLEPTRLACPTASADTQCPTASATLLVACGPATIGPPIPTAAELEAVSDTRLHLALLRHQLSAAMARFN